MTGQEGRKEGYSFQNRGVVHHTAWHCTKRRGEVRPFRDVSRLLCDNTRDTSYRLVTDDQEHRSRVACSPTRIRTTRTSWLQFTTTTLSYHPDTTTIIPSKYNTCIQSIQPLALSSSRTLTSWPSKLRNADRTEDVQPVSTSRHPPTQEPSFSLPFPTAQGLRKTTSGPVRLGGGRAGLFPSAGDHRRDPFAFLFSPRSE